MGPLCAPNLAFASSSLRAQTEVAHSGHAPTLFNRFCETGTTIGAIGIDLSGMIGHDITARLAIIDVGGGYIDFFDQIG